MTPSLVLDGGRVRSPRIRSNFGPRVPRSCWWRSWRKSLRCRSAWGSGRGTPVHGAGMLRGVLRTKQEAAYQADLGSPPRRSRDGAERVQTRTFNKKKDKFQKRRIASQFHGGGPLYALSTNSNNTSCPSCGWSLHRKQVARDHESITKFRNKQISCHTRRSTNIRHPMCRLSLIIPFPENPTTQATTIYPKCG